MKTSHKLSLAVLACAAFATVASWSTQARADAPPKTFRLHLESGLMEIQRGDLDWDDGGDADLDHTAAGLGIPRAGVGLGFAVWRGLVIGGRVETAFYDDDEGFWWGYEDAFALSILPYGEYIFLSGLFRPFVTIYLGVKGLTSDWGPADFSMWGFATGGGGGAHIFLMDRFSIDLTLLLGVWLGGAEADPGNEDGDFVIFESSILFGISGWI